MFVELPRSAWHEFHVGTADSVTFHQDKHSLAIFKNLPPTSDAGMYVLSGISMRSNLVLVSCSNEKMIFRLILCNLLQTVKALMISSILGGWSYALPTAVDGIEASCSLVSSNHGPMGISNGRQ